jgi:hypothetical protein
MSQRSHSHEERCLRHFSKKFTGECSNLLRCNQDRKKIPESRQSQT